MIQKLKNEVTKPAYARLSSAPRKYKRRDGSISVRHTSVDLCFNIGAVRMCSLAQGDMVDLYYDRYNEEWERSLLIVKKDGTQRKLTGSASKANWLTIAIGSAVKQWELPLLLGRHLDILDYIDGDIIIDITDKNTEVRATKEKRRKREKLIARMAFSIGDERGYVFRTTQALKDMMQIAANREDRAVNKIIIELLEGYLEEYHDDLLRSGVDTKPNSRPNPNPSSPFIKE
jgi:hypothetical protein